MTTIKIRNNLGTTIKTDKYGNMEITGNYTYQISAGQVHEDAPTNSMSAQAIAGGKEGEQPPIKNKNSKAVIAGMLRRKFKD